MKVLKIVGALLLLSIPIGLLVAIWGGYLILTSRNHPVGVSLYVLGAGLLLLSVVEGHSRSKHPAKDVRIGRFRPSLAFALACLLIYLWLGHPNDVGIIYFGAAASFVFQVFFSLPSYVFRFLLFGHYEH